MSFFSDASPFSFLPFSSPQRKSPAESSSPGPKHQPFPEDIDKALSESLNSESQHNTLNEINALIDEGRKFSFVESREENSMANGFGNNDEQGRGNGYYKEIELQEGMNEEIQREFNGNEEEMYSGRVHSQKSSSSKRINGNLKSPSLSISQKILPSLEIDKPIDNQHLFDSFRQTTMQLEFDSKLKEAQQICFRFFVTVQENPPSQEKISSLSQVIGFLSEKTKEMLTKRTSLLSGLQPIGLSNSETRRTKLSLSQGERFNHPFRISDSFKFLETRAESPSKPKTFLPLNSEGITKRPSNAFSGLRTMKASEKKLKNLEDPNFNESKLRNSLLGSKALTPFSSRSQFAISFLAQSHSKKPGIRASSSLKEPETLKMPRVLFDDFLPNFQSLKKQKISFKSSFSNLKHF